MNNSHVCSDAGWANSKGWGTPSLHHQGVLARLIRRLIETIPAGHELLAAPFDLTLANDAGVQPDLLEASSEDLDRSDGAITPQLAIEILSPSTRLYDLNLKKAHYEKAGINHYWVIDTTTGQPCAWQLEGG